MEAAHVRDDCCGSPCRRPVDRRRRVTTVLLPAIDTWTPGPGFVQRVLVDAPHGHNVVAVHVVRRRGDLETRASPMLLLGAEFGWTEFARIQITGSRIRAVFEVASIRRAPSRSQRAQSAARIQSVVRSLRRHPRIAPHAGLSRRQRKPPTAGSLVAMQNAVDRSTGQ
jgi:hypothetical protein